MGQHNKKTQSFTIYLIKDEYKSLQTLIKKDKNVTSFPIQYDELKTGHLFVEKKFPKPPGWTKLFKDKINIKEINNVSTSSAVLVLEVSNKIFAITFGHGKALLVTDSWEERFGLRVTLNCIDADKVRSIDKKTLDAITKQSKEQASRAAPPSEFGLNIEQDLLRAVTGKPIQKQYGSRMSGMDSLHVTIKADIDDIPHLLTIFYLKYNDDSYKKTFPWVDHIAEIKSKFLVSELDGILVKKIKSHDINRIWLAVPEVIKWEDVSGFRYTLASNKPEFTDIHLEQFLNSIKNLKDLSIKNLKKNSVYCINNEGILTDKWSVYKCLYGEISNSSDTHILSGGKWYCIDTNFVKTVNESYSGIPEYDKTLPIYNHNSETEYNKAVSQSYPSIYALMDRKNISHGGGYSKIEFCDLYSSAKDILHVKRYGGSSVLSHLFFQGVNSAELFQVDTTFRDKVNSKLPNYFKIGDISRRPDYEEFQVVYAIISDIDGELEIPFFSKLSLKNSRRRLEGFGYRVALAKIEVSDRVKMFQKFRNKIKRKK